MFFSPPSAASSAAPSRPWPFLSAIMAIGYGACGAAAFWAFLRWSTAGRRALFSSSLNIGPRSAPASSIYKLIYTVPPSHLAATKQAIFSAGGGTYEMGKYTNTTFESSGVGVFTPDRGANPAIGAVGEEERVEEVRVEVRCEGELVARRAVEAKGNTFHINSLLRSHPYETVGYEVFRAHDPLMSISKAELLKHSSSSS